MTSKGTIGRVSRFQRKQIQAYYWKLDGFSKLTKYNDHFYYSPDFLFKGHTCDLKFYPNGTSGKEGFLGLLFRCRSIASDGISNAHLTLGLKTGTGRIEKCFIQNVFFSSPGELGASTVIQRSEFLKRKEDLAPSDCLTFVVILGPEALEIIRDFGDQTETDHSEKNFDEGKKGTDKVADDLSKLLASGDRSDATIVVGESEYKVHSCILAARTPVFAALFEHDTLEKATRKITITDCEPAIFGEFLNYIYSGSVRDLTSKNSVGLYLVADKYLVNELKQVCRESIQDNLSSESFCEAVHLALRCKDEGLLETAFDYFAINFRHIIRSVEWQRYIEENPREANEIFIRSLGPP